MSALAQPENPSKGMLLYNGQLVGSLQTMLSRLDCNLGALPGQINLVAKGECWRAFKFPDSPEHRWNAADFRRFIESPRKDGGCETPIGVLERALRDTEAWETFLKLTRGEQGGPNNIDPVSDPATGRFVSTVNRDVITVDGEPTVLPHPARDRDYTREAPTGTSVSYALRRLERNAPEYFEKVRRHELSPHAAMVAAGFKSKSITIPFDPEKAARRLAKHFKGADLDRLINALESTKYDDTLDDEA